MKERIASRVKGVAGSATLAASEKARQLRRQGFDVIDLGGGDPDFKTPQHIIEAAYEAMDEGFTHYVSTRGIKELLDAIAVKLQHDNGLVYNPDKEIVVTPSGKFALYGALMATIDPGDEVLVLEPAWVTYAPVVQLAEGVPVPVSLDKKENLRITKAKLASKLTPRTKLMIVNSPNNPTGRVMIQEEAQAIADFAIENDVMVLADEIYEKIIYDGRQHISLGTLPGMWEHTLTLNGFSKTYAMCGWRLGYLAGPKDIVDQVVKLQEQSASCAASFTQRAGVAALTGPQECVAEMVQQYNIRRKLITDGLNSLPGVKCRTIEGSFYAFPDISGTGMSSADFADMLLNEAHVSATFGSAFGAAGEGHIRFSFANPTDLLEKAMERMEKALAARVGR